MVNKQGHLEDNDISQNLEDDQSQPDLDASGGRRDVLRGTREESSFDEDNLGHYSDGGLEHSSPLRHSGHPRVPQVDSGTEPTFPPPFEWEGKTSYSQLGVNLIESIRNSKKCKASSEVLQHSWVLIRNVIQLKLNSERRAGQWAKGCSIHQMFGSPKMLLHSCPRTSL